MSINKVFKVEKPKKLYKAVFNRGVNYLKIN